MVLTTFSSRLEADVAVAKLAAHGIDAWILTDSANGFEPQWDWVRGVRVLTADVDIPDAADILEVEPEAAPEPLSEERERMVRIVRNVIFGAAAIGVLIALSDAIR